MQNGLKRLRTDSLVTNGDISDTIQEFPTGGNRQQPQQASQKHPLYSRGVCTLAGCESTCDTYNAFMSHMNREHVLDERSTAQTRVQVSTY